MALYATLGATLGLVAGLLDTNAIAQSTPDTIEAHMAAAKAAAGAEYAGVLQRLCIKPDAGLSPQVAPGAPPDRSTWLSTPVKVFDNLYFVGTIEHSAWAVTTSDGIILVDTIYDYTIDAIVDGLKKLGLDPAKIKYAIVSHGHGDHAGGAKYLQEHFGTHIILSAADWDLVEKSPRVPAKPKRDMVATDGQKLTLGDTTLTLYLTPGHTPGTISTLIPVKDGGKSHLVAEWGGTAFNFEHTPQAFQTYIASAERFSKIVRETGADVLIANHTIFDGSKTKLPAVLKRKPGDPNPYVIGNDSVGRYMKVAEECARVALLRTK
jgi:metallo-beta-lactamase class B